MEKKCIILLLALVFYPFLNISHPGLRQGNKTPEITPQQLLENLQNKIYRKFFAILLLALLCGTSLVAVAEHGGDSRAILVSTSKEILEEVSQKVASQVQDLPRRDFAVEALAGSFFIQVPSLEKAFEFVNRYAPEHLILHLEGPENWVEKVQSAGSVFLGPWSPEVAGDYASGTNHTLPTSGLARAFSGVSLDTSVKKITFQELTQKGLRELAPILETLAALEGLEGHGRAVRARLKQLTADDRQQTGDSR